MPPVPLTMAISNTRPYTEAAAVHCVRVATVEGLEGLRMKAVNIRDLSQLGSK